MPPIEESAVRVLRDLRELAYGCALVGGLAVGVRARPRTTLDVDFAVENRIELLRGQTPEVMVMRWSR